MGSRDVTPQAEAPEVPFLVRFYSEEGATDHAGRTLANILSFDNRTLETTHDYIQYLFPVSVSEPALARFRAKTNFSASRKLSP